MPKIWNKKMMKSLVFNLHQTHLLSMALPKHKIQVSGIPDPSLKNHRSSVIFQFK